MKRGILQRFFATALSAAFAGNASFASPFQDVSVTGRSIDSTLLFSQEAITGAELLAPLKSYSSPLAAQQKEAAVHTIPNTPPQAPAWPEKAIQWTSINKAPDFISAMAQRAGMRVEKIEILPLAGSENVADVLDRAKFGPELEAGISAANHAAISMMSFAAEGKDPKSVSESKKRVDANGVQAIHEQLVAFFKANSKKSGIILTSEGKRDGAAFTPSLRIYHHTYKENVSENEHDGYKDFSTPKGGSSEEWIEHVDAFNEEVARLSSQLGVTEFYGIAIDAVDGTNNVIHPDARTTETNAGSILSMALLQHGTDGKLILPRSDDDWRIWAIRSPIKNQGEYFPRFDYSPEEFLVRLALGLAEIPMPVNPDLLSAYIKDPLSLPENALEQLRHTVLFALGERHPLVSKAGKSDWKHILGLQHWSNVARLVQNKLQVIRAGDGNVGPGFFALAGVDLGNGYRLVLNDRLGGVEGLIMAMIARVLGIGTFVGGFVSPTTTNEDLWSRHHHTFTDVELASFKAMGYALEQIVEPIDVQSMPLGVAVYTTGTGMPKWVYQKAILPDGSVASNPEWRLAYGQVADWMRRVRYTPNPDGVGGTIEVNAVAVTPGKKEEDKGQMFVVRTTYVTDDLAHVIGHFRDLNDDGKDFWLTAASKWFVNPHKVLEGTKDWLEVVEKAGALANLDTEEAYKLAADLVYNAANHIGEDLLKALHHYYVGMNLWKSGYEEVAQIHLDRAARAGLTQAKMWMKEAA